MLARHSAPLARHAAARARAGLGEPLESSVARNVAAAVVIGTATLVLVGIGVFLLAAVARAMRGDTGIRSPGWARSRAPAGMASGPTVILLPPPPRALPSGPAVRRLPRRSSGRGGTWWRWRR